MRAEQTKKAGSAAWRPWLILAAAAVLFLLMIRFDVQLLRWRYDVVDIDPHGALGQLVNSFRNFGEFLTTVIVVCIIAAYDRRRKTVIITLLIAQALSTIAYNAGKYTIVRQRPYYAVEQSSLDELTASQSWVGWRIGNSGFKTKSFPSGHSASAFAVAGVLACFYPRLRWMFWILAFGCAASRFVDAVHWPSDCVAGATIGYISSVVARSVAPSS